MNLPARTRVTAALLAFLAMASDARAEGVDPKVALPIMLKVLTYDRNFRTRGAGDFVVLVPAEPGAQATRDELLAMIKTLGLTAILNRDLQFVAADLKDESGLNAQVEKSGAQAILALPGLSAAGVKAISDVGQARQVYTLALDAKMTETVLALGVAAREDGKAQIVINLRAAKAEGAVFENAVLRLAKLIQ